MFWKISDIFGIINHVGWWERGKREMGLDVGFEGFCGLLV